jgi:Peptidase family S41
MPLRLNRRSLALAGAAALAAPRLYAQGPAPAGEISAEAARADLRLLQRALTELHPGLYRYTTPAALSAEFADAESAVAPGSSRAQLYLLAARIAAQVHCGHTWANPLNQRQDLVDSVFQRADKLPLTLRFVEGRALVTGSTTDGVKAGAELLVIDGRPVAVIVTALLPNLRADGLHAGARLKRLAQLDSGNNGGAMDRLFPLRFAPQQGRYTLSLREPGAAAPRVVEVNAVSQAERDRRLPPAAAQWSFTIEGDTAVLRLPTFAFWRSDFKPQPYLQRVFGAIRNLPFLVIDLRDNEGGDDAIGRLVLSHLLRAPHTTPAFRVESAYERVPEDLLRHLDTWDRSFYDRSGKVRRDGPGRNWRLPDQAGVTVQPVAAPYPGRTVLLVGPQNSSAGFLFARDVQAARAATLIGQPTGGNLRGLNGGQLAWVTLPASGVSVDIPLLAAFAPEGTPDAGVQPEVVATPTWDDALAGTDTGMAAARAQIQRWRLPVR